MTHTYNIQSLGHGRQASYCETNAGSPLSSMTIARQSLPSVKEDYADMQADVVGPRVCLEIFSEKFWSNILYRMGVTYRDQIGCTMALES